MFTALFPLSVALFLDQLTTCHRIQTIFQSRNKSSSTTGSISKKSLPPNLYLVRMCRSRSWRKKDLSAGLTKMLKGYSALRARIGTHAPLRTSMRTPNSLALTVCGSVWAALEKKKKKKRKEYMCFPWSCGGLWVNHACHELLVFWRLHTLCLHTLQTLIGGRCSSCLCFSLFPSVTIHPTSGVSVCPLLEAFSSGKICWGTTDCIPRPLPQWPLLLIRWTERVSLG